MPGSAARLPFRSVQGLALTSFVLPPDNVTTIAEHFGIEARFLFQGLYGGASGIIGMLHAARAIRDGFHGIPEFDVERMAIDEDDAVIVVRLDLGGLCRTERLAREKRAE